MSARFALRTAVSTLLLAFVVCTGCKATPPLVPVPKVDAELAAKSGKQTAIFAGGCFWGTQSVFQRVKGVVATTAGYAGGSASTATYAQVTTETTGHAESVKVVYDPSKITYGKLLQIFFSVHDPTTLNRQGPDVGTSYRSAIFYTSDEQRNIASAYIAQLQDAKVFPKKIVTEVTPSKGFYDAEDYHQDYATINPDNPYIMVCDKPKIETLKKEFPDLFVEYKSRR
jgi:peptide-methionine (S)-S-oxide reductase